VLLVGDGPSGALQGRLERSSGDGFDESRNSKRYNSDVSSLVRAGVNGDRIRGWR